MFTQSKSTEQKSTENKTVNQILANQTSVQINDKKQGTTTPEVANERKDETVHATDKKLVTPVADFFNNNGVAIASTVGAVTIASKIVATGIIAAGVASPVGPGIILLLVLAHKLAEVYKAMKNLKELMLDIMRILSNMYRLNNLIDVSNKIFFIYFYNFDNFEDLVRLKDKCVALNNEEKEKKEKDMNTKVIGLFKSALETAKKRVTNYTNVKNVKKCNDSVNEDECVLVTPAVLTQNDITSKCNLLGQISKDKDIERRLFEKITTLTTYLLELSPTPILQELNKDTTITETGFGIILKDEVKKRVGDDGNDKTAKIFDRISSIKRGFQRSFKGKATTDKMVQDLSVISGFYGLMKSQYDFEMDYYSRHLKPEEFKKIWEVIEVQSEYKTFMIPGDLNQSIQFVFANPVKASSDEVLKLKSSIIETQQENTKEQDTSNDQQ